MGGASLVTNGTDRDASGGIFSLRNANPAASSSAPSEIDAKPIISRPDPRALVPVTGSRPDSSGVGVGDVGVLVAVG
jgi:hypothetical protein